MRYPPPTTTPGLPQGDYLFIPRVRVFADYDNSTDLQDDINNFIESVIPNPDERWNIVDVKFSSARYRNNEIRYSALVHYTRIITN